MQEETPISNTVKQYRLSENKRVRIVFDQYPVDPHKDHEKPSEEIIKMVENGEIYSLVYEKRDHCNNETHDCWVTTNSVLGFYGLESAIESIEQ